jgi:hypothetical protein
MIPTSLGYDEITDCVVGEDATSDYPHSLILTQPPEPWFFAHSNHTLYCLSGKRLSCCDSDAPVYYVPKMPELRVDKQMQELMDNIKYKRKIS